MLRITELRACVSLFLDLQYDGNRRRPHGARSFAKGKFQSLILWNKTGRIRQCNSKFSTAVFVNLVPRAFPLKNTHFGRGKALGTRLSLCKYTAKPSSKNLYEPVRLKFVSYGPFYITTCLAKNLKQVLIF